MVGGGILGVGVARRLLQVEPTASVTVLEKEPELARHQTGHNSGVVHAGLYYPPGSLKALLCRRGVGLLRDLCAAHDVPYVECGKLLVALDEVERRRLLEIRDRAVAGGVPGIRLLDAEGIRQIEPHAHGVAGLHSPTTAIVDFVRVTGALAADATAAGASVRTGIEVTGFHRRGVEVVVTGAHGYDAAFDLVVVCAGLQADQVSVLAGDEPDPVIVPFRGEYHLLRPERRSLVRGLLYPVPDPRYPFLGIHLTPRVDGEVLVGPNAVLALAREGYARGTASWPELRSTLLHPGFRAFARRHWRAGLAEMRSSFSHRAFVAAVQRYVPVLQPEDVLPGPAGIRAQALDRDGVLVDDFRIHRRGPVVCVRNAPSPGATSSLAIAEHIVDLALDRPLRFGAS